MAGNCHQFIHSICQRAVNISAALALNSNVRHDDQFQSAANYDKEYRVARLNNSLKVIVSAENRSLRSKTSGRGSGQLDRFRWFINFVHVNAAKVNLWLRQADNLCKHVVTKLSPLFSNGLQPATGDTSYDHPRSTRMFRPETKQQ